jgi:hypothetical protein
MIRISSNCSAHLALVILDNQRMMGLHLSNHFRFLFVNLSSVFRNVMLIDAKEVFR